MNKNTVLRSALRQLEWLSKMDDPSESLVKTVKDIKSVLKAPKHRWQGLTADEFVYFCSYVDHETLDQIENTLRKRNELCSN
jgi:hypothetical protein